MKQIAPLIHEETTDCWCCPTVERVLLEDDDYIDFVIHHEREDAN